MKLYKNTVVGILIVLVGGLEQSLSGLSPDSVGGDVAQRGTARLRMRGQRWYEHQLMCSGGDRRTMGVFDPGQLCGPRGRILGSDAAD